MRQYMLIIGMCLIFTLVFFYFLSTRVEGLRGKKLISQSIQKYQQQKHQQPLKQKHQQPLKQKLPRKKLKQQQKPPSNQPYSGINHMGQSSNLNLNSI
jgi:hypothetical protein